jgi:hypothetical protein
MPKPAKPVGAKSQIQRFREIARELGADATEKTFNAALKRVAKAPPPKESKPIFKKPGN